MSSPELGAAEVVIRGSTWRVRLQMQDADGAALDLTPGAVSVVLRFKPRDADVVLRTKGAAGETTYATDGTDGDITFVFLAAATLAFPTGPAIAEVVYADSGPPEKHLTYRWPVQVEDPRTGAI